MNLYIIALLILVLFAIAIFIVPIFIYTGIKNKTNKNEFEELKQNGQITSIRFKVQKIIYWTECGTTYAYDTYVRTLGDTHIIHTHIIHSTNKLEDNANILTTIIKIELCDLKTVRLICMNGTGEIFKQSISDENVNHLQLTFENGKTTVLFQEMPNNL